MNKVKLVGVGIILLVLALGSFIIFRNLANSRYPQSHPGTGTVIGKLDQSSQQKIEYTAQDLYLGKLIPAGVPNTSPAIAFSYESDPRTIMHDPDGTFAFVDIQPGKYALLVWTPGTSFVIEMSSSEPLLVDVEADKTTDLGTIIMGQ